MKRSLFLLFLFLSVSISFAQTQQGIVKTNGRPNKPGTPLSNVAVRASGRSTSLSTEDGTFSIAMNGMKGGDAFFLTSVTKMGYELADKNSIGRKYGFSASVPMVLTMVSKSEVEAEKQRIRNNAIVAAQKEYEQRVEELEKMLEEQTITADAFGEQLQELQANMDKYNELVENLADKYARTDYDQIDAIDQEINQAIEEGLFDKADSLIHTKGNIDERHQKAIEWSQSSKKQKEALDQQMAQWENSEASRRKELENLAEDYYHNFTIEVSRMHHEEAAKWLEKRVELDPERFEWLIEAGRYYKDYLAKYDRAMDLFEQADAVANRTKQISQLLTAQNEKGGVYAKLHDLENAENCFMEMILRIEGNESEETHALASAYTNLGFLESMNGNYDKALSYYEKAICVSRDTISTHTASVYSNISSVYCHKSQFDSAEVYLDRAISIAKQIDNKRVLSGVLVNKGAILHNQGKDKAAIALYEKGLEIQKEIFPSTHPSIAGTMGNLATSYQALSRLKESLEYVVQSLAIYQEIYGEKHPNVAYCYGELSSIFLNAGNYDKTLDFANKAWEINRLFYPENSLEHAKYCNTLGRVYNGLKQDSLALDYYLKTIEIYDAQNMSNTNKYAEVCNNLSCCYLNLKEYQKAVECNQKGLCIYADLMGKSSVSYITLMNNLADIYKNCNKIDSALIVYRETEKLILDNYGKWHVQLGYNYNNVGSLFITTKEYDKAREYLYKSLEICDSIYSEPAELPMVVLSNIAMTYFNDEKWRETLPWIEKAAVMRSQLVKDPQRKLVYHSYIYNCYSKLAKSGDLEDTKRFKECQDSLWFKVRVTPGSIAEQKYGLKGEYEILCYGNWEQGCMLNFKDEADRMKGSSPFEMIVYRDGKIERWHFEEKTIGVTFKIDLLGKSESQSIKEAYAKWKSENIKE